MRIVLVEVKNIMRVSHARVVPPADASVFVIAGKNYSGKSSLLAAMDMCLRGKRAMPEMPVHRGELDGEIKIELDNGLVVERVILPSRETELVVSDATGKRKSAQAILDEIVGARFVDPLWFLRAGDTEQRQALIDVIDPGGKLRDLDVRYENIFKTRTNTGRDQKKAQGEFDRLPAPIDAGKPVDVAELSVERAKFSDEQRAGDGLGYDAREALAAHDVAVADLKNVGDRIRDLEAELEAAKTEQHALAGVLMERKRALSAADQAVAAAGAAWAKSLTRRLEIDAAIKNADEHNRGVFEAEAAGKRRAAAAAEVERLSALYAEQTAALRKIDGQKAAFLKAAKLPIPDLSFDDKGLTYPDATGQPVPFAQASAAQRFTVAVAVACAASPKLDDVWVRDGAILDEDMLAALGQFAAGAGKRIWVEMIHATPGALVMSEGKVVE